MSQQDGLDTDKLSAVHTESSLLSFIISIKILCTDKTKYMNLHELLYFFNIHLNLFNKTLRRWQRTKQMHVTSPFLFFFTLQVTVRDSNKRLGHTKQRLIIYRVSKGMCGRQLRDLQCLAQVSGNVFRLSRPAGESGGHCQVPASTPLHLLVLPGGREPPWRCHLHTWKIHAKCFHHTSVLILFF